MSYLLYLQWKPVYALILLGVTVVTFYSALAVAKAKHPKRIVTIGVLLALLPLVFFKYFNFINETVSDGLAMIVNDHFSVWSFKI